MQIPEQDYLILPKWILDLDIGSNEKIVLAYIYSIGTYDKFINNLSKKLNIPFSTLKRVLDNLVKLKYLVKHKDKQTGIITYSINKS